MKVDRSNEFVWGGRVIEEEHGSMRGYELPDPSTVTEFYRELPRPEGEPEEVVYLGELRQATEEPARPAGAMGGRLWGHVSSWLGGGDGVG